MSELNTRSKDKRKPGPVLLSFSGIDGSGKSTQIKKLCTELAGRGFSVIQMAFWDHVVAFPRMRARFSHSVLGSEVGVGAPERPIDRKDKNTQAWYLSLARAFLYLFDSARLSRAVRQARKRNSDFIVFDRYIYDQLATLPLSNLVARAYVRLIIKFVPVPDVAYLLDAIPEVARARKPEYPLDFLHKYRNSYLALASMVGLEVVPAMPLEFVQAAVDERIQLCLASNSSSIQENAFFQPESLSASDNVAGPLHADYSSSSERA